MTKTRDHGGGLDAAMAQFGGHPDQWLDLSTGINPHAYPLDAASPADWARLPDRGAQSALIEAARQFWNVPQDAAILAAPGTSALIARLPSLWAADKVHIAQRTYNEHGAAFASCGWTVTQSQARTGVVVHPNNPDGQFAQEAGLANYERLIVDESFCDLAPDRSLVHLAAQPGRIVLKSFGKFWGLAGLRLGFAIGDPDLIAPLAERLGPWPVAGPALSIGSAALRDRTWAAAMRDTLARDAARLDRAMAGAGAARVGGTDLYGLWAVPDATKFQNHMAQHRVLVRIFPYDPTWVRIGLPSPDRWDQVEAALKDAPL